MATGYWVDYRSVGRMLPRGINGPKLLLFSSITDDELIPGFLSSVFVGGGFQFHFFVNRHKSQTELVSVNTPPEPEQGHMQGVILIVSQQ